MNDMRHDTFYESDSDDCGRRRPCRDSGRRGGHNTDCCDCNIELRRDIDILKSQVHRLDQTMNTSLKKIVSLLEGSSEYQSDGRKLGISMRSYTSRDGNANTSV